MNYAPSSKADWSNLKFNRVRSDRHFIDLERSKVPESYLKLAGNTLGVIVFMAAVILGLMR